MGVRDVCEVAKSAVAAIVTVAVGVSIGEYGVAIALTKVFVIDWRRKRQWCPDVIARLLGHTGTVSGGAFHSRLEQTRIQDIF